MNKLTVLMPSYNRGAYINEAVTSVLNQKTDFGVKLIITDDCSTDGSIEVIKELQRQYPEKIEIILSEKNERLLANILKAQVRVRTEYFCVLDPDDYYTDEFFLQKAVDFLDAHKDFTIYSSNCMMLYENKTEKPFIESNVKEAIFDFNDLLQDKVIITQTAGSVFRNTIYHNGIPVIIKDAIGTLSEASFREDTCRYIIHLNTGNAFFKNEITAVYRIHHNGIWAKASTFQKLLRSCVQFYDLGCYFNHKFDSYFIITSVYYAKQCLKELERLIDSKQIQSTITIEELILLFTTVKKTEDCNYVECQSIPKTSRKQILSLKKILKFMLPYGFVRLIQKIKETRI